MTAIEPPVLRPMTLGQLFDRTFRLYRQNFLTFVGIIAAMVIPVYGINLLFTLLNLPQTLEASTRLPRTISSSWQMLFTEMQAAGAGNSVLLAILSFVLIQGIAAAALVKAIEDSYLGRQADILGSYGKSARIWLPLLGVLIVEVVFALVLILWTVIVPCIGWLTGPGMLIFTSYAIFPLVPAVVVIENQRGLQAIRRVWELVRRRFWWVLGYALLLIVLTYILTAGPSFLLGLAIGYLRQALFSGTDTLTQMSIQTSLTQVINSVVQIIYLPIQITAFVIMYFDLRVRTEGFDLAIQAAEPVASDNGEPVLPVTPPAPAGATAGNSLITGNEIGYFFGMTIGVGALCGILYGGLILLSILIVGGMGGL